MGNKLELARIETLKNRFRTRFWVGMVAHYLEISPRAAAKQLRRYEKHGIVCFTGKLFSRQKIYVWADSARKNKPEFEPLANTIILALPALEDKRVRMMAAIKQVSVHDLIVGMVKNAVEEIDWKQALGE